MSGVVSLPILFFLVRPITVSKWSLIAIPIGIVQGLGFLFYNKAIVMEEVSKVVPVLTMNPIFTLPLAFIFLGEKLRLVNYLGILIMLTAVILITYKKSESKKRFLSKAILLTFITTLILSIVNILTKSLLVHVDNWSLVFWMSIGFLSGGFILLVSGKNRTNLKREITKKKIKPIIILRLASTTFYLTGLLIFYKALSAGSVSIITSLGSIQPFFVLLYATILTKLSILEEEIDKHTISLKFLSIVMIIIGTYLTVL